MRQRLHIARGLLHDPPVLFLDEPTIGVDPVGARQLRALIASLTQAGKTVLLTTHYMFEADSLCDRIAVIAKGEIVAQGTPQQLKARVEQSGVVEIEVFGIDEASLRRVEQLPGVLTVVVEEQEQKQLLIVQTTPGAELTHVDPRAAADGVGRPRRLARADARGRLRAARDCVIAARPGRLAGRPLPLQASLAERVRRDDDDDLAARLRVARLLHVPGRRRARDAPARLARRQR